MGRGGVACVIGRGAPAGLSMASDVPLTASFPVSRLAERLAAEARLLAASDFAGLYHDRMVSPAETVARLRPAFPALGITRLARVTGLDRIGIPVFIAVR